MLLLHGAMIAAPLALLFTHRLFHVNRLGICVFQSVFGVECPACGMTHAAAAMLSGDVAQSFREHPAGPLIVALLVVMTAYFALTVVAGWQGLDWRQEARTYSRLETVALAALLIGWIGKAFTN